MLLHCPECYKTPVHFELKLCAVFQRYLNLWNINPKTRYFTCYGHLIYSIKISIWFSIFVSLEPTITPQNFSLCYGMIVWWLCWYRPLLMNNIRQQPCPQCPTVHDFRKSRRGVAYVLCVANSRATSYLGDRRCPSMFGVYSGYIHVTGAMSTAHCKS